MPRSSRRISTINDIYGGRAALKIDLDDNWTVTPTVHAPEDQGRRRLLLSIPTLGDLKIERFRKEIEQGPVLAGCADRRRQDREFRRHLCRRLHGPADHSALATIPITPMLTTVYYEYVRRHLANYLLFPRRRRQHRSIRSQYIIGTQPLQEAEPGTARRIAGGQAVPGHRRRLLPATRRTTSPGISGRQSGARAVGQRLSRDLLADPAEARRPRLCAVRRSELRRHAADHADRRRPLLQVRQHPHRLRRLRPEPGINSRRDNPLPNAAGSSQPASPSASRRAANASRFPAIRHRHDADPASRRWNALHQRRRVRERQGRAQASKGTASPTASTRSGSRSEDLMFYATWSKGFRPGGINRQPTAPALRRRTS